MICITPVKNILTAASFFFLVLITANCGQKIQGPSYLVTTSVVIKEGKIDEVLNLFKQTNPDLVKDQVDWEKAIFSINREKNLVMVFAYWKNKGSYLSFRQSQNFQNTMAKFETYFDSKPIVEINEILFEM